jgi:hypothetical protein
MDDVESSTVDVTLDASIKGTAALIESREAFKQGTRATGPLDEFAATQETCIRNASVGAMATVEGMENSAKKYAFNAAPLKLTALRERSGIDVADQEYAEEDKFEAVSKCQSGTVDGAASTVDCHGVVRSINVISCALTL